MGDTGGLPGPTCDIDSSLRNEIEMYVNSPWARDMRQLDELINGVLSHSSADLTPV